MGCTVAIFKALLSQAEKERTRPGLPAPTASASPEKLTPTPFGHPPCLPKTPMGPSDGSVCTVVFQLDRGAVPLLLARRPRGRLTRQACALRPCHCRLTAGRAGLDEQARGTLLAGIPTLPGGAHC